MKRCIITTMTSTLAMKVQRVLSANGIGSDVIRLPSGLNTSGCAFGAEINCADADMAKRVLYVTGTSYGKFIII